ncbi:Sodium/calcium exchanger 3 [Nibea albiflora]|uniref:Sodium/calcium exchanger 3 n=1 Tax=Nibea albiflora TaxID=240163 RepID=A0ACB7ELN0_NIBAL|nr:Sodium/calcium exchanger 3 [Nibea albiflora]
MYMFLGVSIIADRFMASIEVITSQAAFNMFVIIGICVWTIPNGESRKIKHPGVLHHRLLEHLRYIWLYLILSVMTQASWSFCFWHRQRLAHSENSLLAPGWKNVLVPAVRSFAGGCCKYQNSHDALSSHRGTSRASVTGLLKRVGGPGDPAVLPCVCHPGLDRRPPPPLYKYMGKRYRADKRRGIVVETEGDLTPNKGGMEMIADGKFPARGRRGTRRELRRRDSRWHSGRRGQ